MAKQKNNQTKNNKNFWKVILPIITFIFVVATIFVLAAKITINKNLFDESQFGKTPLEVSIEKKRFAHNLNSEIKRHEIYTNFVNKKHFNELKKIYQNKINKRNANENEQKKFNELYEANPVFRDFNTLQSKIANTHLGDYKSQALWEKLYTDFGFYGEFLNKVKQRILRIYNVFAKLFGENLALTIIQAVYPMALKENEQSIATTIALPFRNNEYSILMKYKNSFANLSLINEDYNNGWFSTASYTSVLAHELGHAFSFYLSLPKSYRKNFNNNWLNSKESKLNLSKDWKSDVNIENWGNQTFDLINWLSEQVKKDFSSNIFKYSHKDLWCKLFPAMLLQSNYGRTFWTSKDIGLRDEYFAEAFALWIDGDKEDRNWTWELLNKYFTHKIPYQLNISF